MSFDCWTLEWTERLRLEGILAVHCKHPVSFYRKSRDTGCAVCRFLLCVVDEFRPGWTTEKPPVQRCLDLDDNLGRGDFTVSLLDSDDLVGSFQLCRRSGEEPMYRNHSSDSTVDCPLRYCLKVVSDSQHDAAFDRAAKWLSYCVAHDEFCQLPDPTFKPRRLLHVGSLETAFQPLFLFEPKEPSPYVTLSYCWGSDADDVLKTTKTNLELHCRYIQFSSLPKTVRDAVEVCRKLHICYLWVDSLCIIQDDADDWRQESARMTNIYGNSHLTIVAREPASCKLGFLGKQKYGSADWQQPCKAEIPDEYGHEVYIRVGKVDEGTRSLDKRAWCLQEGIIPNRKLVFDGNEMAWECCHRKICECGHLSCSLTNSWGGLKHDGILGYGTTRAHDANKAQKDWRAIVEEYTLRNLSRETDKLAAISGLAEMMSNAQNGTLDVYLAGLWQSRLISGLSWSVDKKTLMSGYPPFRRQLNYRAPSWSWASIDGPVKYTYLDTVSTWTKTPSMIHHAKVDEAICTPALLFHPTGPVTAGHAILTGPLVPVELAVLDQHLGAEWCSQKSGDWEQPPVGQVTLVRSQNLKSYPVNIDMQMEPSLQKGDAQSPCWIEGRCMGGCCQLNDEKAIELRFEMNGAQYFCFRLFTWEDCSAESRTLCSDSSGRVLVRRVCPQSWYLVLQKSLSVEDAYERIGMGIWDAQDYERNDIPDNENPLILYLGRPVVDVRYRCALFEHAEIKTIRII